MSKAIQAIIFDLSEVLLQGLLGVHEQLGSRIGVSPSRLELQIPELKALFEGRISEHEYWSALVDKHCWAITSEELHDLVRQGFREIPGTRAIISELRRSGYRIGLLSVHAREWISYCEDRFSFRELFDEVSYSFETGTCKPAAQSFAMILERLRCRPQQALFIDDMPGNLDAASMIGMHTLQFFSAARLRRDLRLFGISLTSNKNSP
ncbi:HAD family hydrolase [Bradyrhizobium sp. Pa8]|uniref:HAD family hydrolase n=1 Tax=Bradyrhizobium sp. Pa8 TaxID=3386552 RepID=UPI00403EF763